MEQRHRDLLCANSFEITSDLRFRDIRGYLLDKGVLSGDNLNEIESKKLRVDQAKALLNILPTRGLNAFSVFRDALKLHYPHLARLLDDESQHEPLKGEPRIFIIHAGEDKEHFVRPLVSALRQKGLKEDDIFFDEVSIKPGEHIRERIMSTLSSDALQLAVIVVSNSLLSKNYWPKLELEKCLNKKCVFPIWLDENEDNFKAFSELVGNYSPTLKQMSARRVQRTSVESELANIATEVVQQLSALEKSQPTAIQMLLHAAPTSARSVDSVSSDEGTGSEDDGTGLDDQLLIQEKLKEKKMESELEILEKWGDIQLKWLERASHFLSKEKVEQQTEEMFAQLRQKFDILMVKEGCAIVHLIPNNLTDLDRFWADYKSGQLSNELSQRLITDEMRAVVGQDLVVQVIMLEEQYRRWRKYLTESRYHHLINSISIHNI
ncbi:PREDICTED: uncharacterized protein LOC109466871 [Branchiostoma belcheri]|uniref:Uncharacterized protein LOC109466871 n=1 Tax=Branchiostoma belcheri TaxID=7741 RepID=A0A6P4YDV3_BRABE|nr:PREDICTED: uncharacterized protein LOC109466871 [Branchiostoma belcheri]